MTTELRPRYMYTVASRGSRLYYQVPRALHEVRSLDGLITDFYTPDFAYRYRQFLPRPLGDLCARRYESHVPSGSVRSTLPLKEGLRLVLGGGGKVPKPYFGPSALRIGQLTAQASRKRGTASLVNGYHSPAFVAAGSGSSTRPGFIHQEHPPPSQILSVVTAARRQGWYQGREPEENLTMAEIGFCERALREADGIIVASDFVRRGLLGIGVSPSRICVVPLGGDRFPSGDVEHWSSRRPPSSCGPLRVLWVGQPASRKGFHQFLEAVARIPPQKVAIALVFPSATTNLRLPPGFPPTRVYRHITPAELHSLYLQHDVFVMPSLYEGFGMVYAEALNAGLPVVCTPNTGVADMVTDGVEGWVVAPGDDAALTELLLACARDVGRVQAMRPAAAALGARLTWSGFRTQLLDAICMLEASWVARGV